MSRKDIGFQLVKDEDYEQNGRTSLLMEANELVNGDRNNQYGPPSQDFNKIAGQLNALGFRIEGNLLEPHHVAMIQICVKMSRLTWSPGKRDSWVDLAGYAACGWDCVADEDDVQG